MSKIRELTQETALTDSSLIITQADDEISDTKKTPLSLLKTFLSNVFALKTEAGNMFKSVYDTNNSGIVDNAEKVNGHTVDIDVPANAMFTDTTYGVATETTNGLMSSNDKIKLNNIPAISAFIGEVKQVAFSNVPQGWLLCDGSAISRTTYSALFSAIGTNYGVGNGSTTFNLPNLKGKVPVGLDTSQTEFNTLGKTGGEKTHVLTTPEMPSHSHTGLTSYSIVLNYPFGTNNLQSGTNSALVPASSGSSGSTGSGQAHNNLQPYITLNYIIYTGV